MFDRDVAGLDDLAELADLADLANPALKRTRHSGRRNVLLGAQNT